MQAVNAPCAIVKICDCVGQLSNIDVSGLRSDLNAVDGSLAVRDAAEGRRGAIGVRPRRDGLAGAEADFAGGGHGVEHAGDDLGGARARHLVGGLGLEQFGVGEDDPELVVQAVEQQPEVARLVHRSRGCDRRRPAS